MTVITTQLLDGHLLSPRPKKLIPAAIWKRLLNIILDYIGTILFFSIIIFIIAYLTEHPIKENFIRNQKMYPIAFQGLGIFAMYVYYVVCEYYLNGKTLGKFFTRTIVVTPAGQPPSLNQVLMRSSLRFIPLEGIFLLLKPQSLHDQWSGTLVIEEG
jgi:RDD family.